MRERRNRLIGWGVLAAAAIGIVVAVVDRPQAGRDAAAAAGSGTSVTTSVAAADTPSAVGVQTTDPGAPGYSYAPPPSLAPPANIVATSQAASASPAQMLADLDGDTQPVSDYQAALDALAPKCTQDETFVAGLGNSGYDDLTKNGIHDETRLTVLQHLNESIPDSLGKTDCGQMLAAYATLREG